MTGTNPEQLRRTVVRATIPLIGEYETLTMARIAQAAGVDEADLSAVFADKEAVMQACATTLTEAVGAAIDPAEEMREIAAIRTDQPLTARLVKVIDILDAYDRRLRIDLDSLLPAGVATTVTADAPGNPPSGPQDELRSLGRSPELRQAVAKLLEPDERQLLLPAEILARAFVGMIYGGVRPVGPDQSPLPAEQIVHLFLHGALNTR